MLDGLELPHLDGHSLVSIGNRDGAATHIQLVRVFFIFSRGFWFGYNWLGFEF